MPNAMLKAHQQPLTAREIAEASRTKGDSLLDVIEESRLIVTYLRGRKAQETLRRRSLSPAARAKTELEVEASKAAIERLVRCNQRLVAKWASALGHRMSMADLMQEGNVGLIVALQRFDPRKNNRLSTYASHYVKRYIIDYVKQQSHLVHTSEYAVGVKSKSDRAYEDFCQKHHREPTIADLGRELNMSPESLQQVSSAFSSVSLDAPQYEDGATLGNDIADSNAPDPADVVVCRESVRSFLSCLDKLTPEERAYIIQHFGLEDLVWPVTKGKKSASTRRWSRRVERSALRRLREVTEVLWRDDALPLSGRQAFRQFGSHQQRLSSSTLLRGARRKIDELAADASWSDILEEALVSLGGSADLKTIYAVVDGHPKTYTCRTWRNSLRACLQRNPEQFVPCGRGHWKLCVQTHLSWTNLVANAIARHGGRATLDDIYRCLEDHPKTKNKPNWRETVRTTLQRRKKRFYSCDRGSWAVKY